METYIVRQPILDSQHQVVAYEILYNESSTALAAQRDVNVATAIEQFLTNLNDDNFLDGKSAFFTFTPNLLMKNVPKIFSPDKMVIQIDDSAIIHPVAQKIIYRYQKQGYRIAVSGFEFNSRYFGIMDVVDIIKVNCAGNTLAQENVVRVAHSFQKKVAAYNINTPEALEYAKSLGCHYFQGSYVAEQKKSKIHRVDHMQSNFFLLMLAVTKDEPDISEITSIISRDVTLAFSLIKLVNSAYFARRNPVRSVQQALVILGLAQLKQWIYLLSFKQDGSGLQDEMIKISFLRGKFCEALASYAPRVTISANEAYLMGMFSMLGVLMEVPIESALDELPISESIKRALLYEEGPEGDLFGLVLSYEKADWSAMTAHAEQLNIPMGVITHIYFECVEYVNEIWRNLQTPVQQTGEKPEKSED